MLPARLPAERTCAGGTSRCSRNELDCEQLSARPCSTRRRRRRPCLQVEHKLSTLAKDVDLSPGGAKGLSQEELEQAREEWREEVGHGSGQKPQPHGKRH
jgi:hypothetical protein